MNLRNLMFTENACYKAGEKIKVKGIMVHSTGANNPTLKRYVGPNDGLLGVNSYNNHWNTYHPEGREVCPHAFIGKLADGSIATYQVLPWDHRGWHCGSGTKGSGNNTHISFEICEDGLADSGYFNRVYTEAVELCAYLCKLYGLTEKNIICHSEGYKQGIASNHGDVMHWFPKHGKTMDTFRAAVKTKLTGSSGSTSGSTGDPLYRVRKNWADKASQKGAFAVLDNAKRCADQNAGYSVFDESGRVVYTGNGSYPTYTVKKGDSLWAIASRELGSGTRYSEIKKLNNLTSDLIYAGQVLKIPK